MKVFRHLLMAAFVALCLITAQAQDCGPRVRKAWRMLSDKEKRIYKDAIAASLDKGEFFEFTKIHVHHMSEKQAHNTCAFLIWHKRFLLGFENMLRSMTPESRCLTVPYWDSMTEYAQMIDGQCKNIYDCAPIIRELTGEPTGASQTVAIAGRSVTGQCYPGFPGYCADDKSVCDCVPRGDLRTRSIPAASGFQTLFNQIAYSKDFEAFGKSIQSGIHNDMHSQLGGFMSTFYSPNDMLFWSWHATIDMLLYVYHQCHLAEGTSADEMKTSAYAFSQDGDCRYSDDAPDAVVHGELLQMSAVNGVNYKARDNPIIGKYFQSLSSDVSAMLGFRNLGEHSYTYEIPEAFKKHLLLKHELCPVFAQAVGVSQPTPAPATTTAAPPPGGENPDQPTTPTVAPAPPSTDAPPLTTQPPHDFGDANGEYDPGTVHPEEPQQTPIPINGDGPDVGDDEDNYQQGDGSHNHEYGFGSDRGEHNGGSEYRDDATETPSPTPTPTPAPAPTAPPTEAPTTPPPPPPPPPPPAPTPAPGPPPVVVHIDQALIDVNENDQSFQTPKYWEWANTARQNLDKVFPGNYEEVANQLQYLECMSYRDQFGIHNFSAQFITDFHLTEGQHKPLCVKKCDEVDEGKKEVVVEATKFEPKKVAIKPGVTPAPPMIPMKVATNVIGSVTVAPSEASTKQSIAVALSPTPTATVLAVIVSVLSLC